MQLTGAHSDLSIEKYHAYSDATMDRMLESIETLLDDLGDPNYEVEYSVRTTFAPKPRHRPWPSRAVCHKL